MKKLFLINIVAVSLVVAAAVTPALAASDDAVTCQPATARVALAPGQPASYTVSGELCATQEELQAGTTVQLLIHGATYNHDYWDFGTINGVRYSFARDVAAHGLHSPLTCSVREIARIRRVTC